MWVLVTGGTGFVGCHTVAALVGHGQRSKDSLCPSGPPDGLRRRPARARSPPGRHCTTARLIG
jgi:uncharacterized protein YbjT (DUF2867 family)